MEIYAARYNKARPQSEVTFAGGANGHSLRYATKLSAHTNGQCVWQNMELPVKEFDDAIEGRLNAAHHVLPSARR